MAGGPTTSNTYLIIGVGASTFLLVIVVVLLLMKRLKSRGTKRPYENVRIVTSETSTWYDPQFQKLVPEQVGQGDVHVEEGLLAVMTPVKRAKSAECLTETCNETSPMRNFWTSKEFSVSTQSLASLLGDENSFLDLDEDSPRRHSYSYRSSPYVEFNLMWATSGSSLSVYVIRITSLPPSYTNATCSYKVTLCKPDKTTISRSSNKVRSVNLNPDCFQVFSFKVPLEDVRKSKLVLEVYARKSKHFLSKSIGQLQYQLPSSLMADKPHTTSQPLRVNKKGCSSVTESPRGSRGSLSSFPGSHWGELQVLAQYQITGGWQGRIKIMIIKAQNSLIGKGGGSYKVELIVKKGEETDTVHQTKQVQGPNPVWKAPFIFDVTQAKVNDYRVEINLIRMTRIKKASTVGQAALGLNTTPSGTTHWQDLVSSPNKEITVWHPVSHPED